MGEGFIKAIVRPWLAPAQNRYLNNGQYYSNMDSIIQKFMKRGRILELLVKYPERDFTVNEISRLAGLPYATTWRFMKDCDSAGIVFMKKIGNCNVCRLNKDSLFLKEVLNALKSKPTPQSAVLRHFVNGMQKAKSVERIVLFGSVAEGKERPESDVDIALIASKRDPALEKLATGLADEILKKSKVKVIPIILTEKEAEGSSQFAEEIRKGVVLYERNKGS